MDKKKKLKPPKLTMDAMMERLKGVKPDPNDDHESGIEDTHDVHMFRALAAREAARQAEGGSSDEGED